MNVSVDPRLYQARDALLNRLSSCKLCPRRCGVDRLNDRKNGYCRTGRWAGVASTFAHPGEERPLSGWRGSGTIFFTACSLHCKFCQNYDISRGNPSATTVDANALASIMLDLQRSGVHNINFVTPTHVIAQIIEALVIAREKGLHLPVVYNSGGYDSLDTLRILDGLIDIYLPDFKTLSEHFAKKYLDAPNYPEVAKKAVSEMFHQVGLLKTDSKGLATSGLIVRHLVMPSQLKDTERILQWISENCDPGVTVNVMGQYHPAYLASQYPELKQPLHHSEYQKALALKDNIMNA